MVKIMCVDDVAMHLNLIQSSLRMLKNKGLEVEIVGTAINGLEAYALFQKLVTVNNRPDIVTLDIRMPVLDGLSTLVKIKAMYSAQKVIMVSSEDENTVSRTPLTSKLSDADKMALVQKVVPRVKANMQEPGKINNILQACDELHINPIEVAKNLQSQGYLHKPYDPDKVFAVVNAVVANKPFTSAL
jgi:CheY-like chemotaxis protein